MLKISAKERKEHGEMLEKLNRAYGLLDEKAFEELRRDREVARRRAERSAIYNMLESFPRDFACNPDGVRKWLAQWQKYGDELCEGGKYAE